MKKDVAFVQYLFFLNFIVFFTFFLIFLQFFYVFLHFLLFFYYFSFFLKRKMREKFGVAVTALDW